jgi:serine-type D-Ala-D-Ala carboxypeptidase (penicillin-binding protein 5/6)
VLISLSSRWQRRDVSVVCQGCPGDIHHKQKKRFFNSTDGICFPEYTGEVMHNCRFFFFTLGLIMLPAVAYAVLPTPPPTGITAKNYLLMDAHSGAVLIENNPDERVQPASLTKIMTAYLVFKELQSGRLSLDEPLLISENAWRTGMRGASRMFIEVGNQVMVEDLIRGMIVQSGNDACVALAERIAGTEAAFLDMMNAQARTLGMNNTHFQNSHGLPSKDLQFSSALDIAILARGLIRNFPEYYGYYSEQSFTYNDITQHNRNMLLRRDQFVDGVKTGWTIEAGYNLVSSAKREEMRLICVVMGISASSGRQGAQARADQSQALLNWGFRQFETLALKEPDQIVAEPRIWKGREKYLPIGVNESFFVTIPRGSQENLRLEISLPDDIEAPVDAGQQLGVMHAVLGDEKMATRQLIAMESVPRGGFFRVLIDMVTRMILSFFA